MPIKQRMLASVCFMNKPLLLKNIQNNLAYIFKEHVKNSYTNNLTEPIHPYWFSWLNLLISKRNQVQLIFIAVTID